MSFFIEYALLGEIRIFVREVIYGEQQAFTLATSRRVMAAPDARELTRMAG
jgi:hypothetical protein